MLDLSWSAELTLLASGGLLGGGGGGGGSGSGPLPGLPDPLTLLGSAASVILGFASEFLLFPALFMLVRAAHRYSQASYQHRHPAQRRESEFHNSGVGYLGPLNVQ